MGNLTPKLDASLSAQPTDQGEAASTDHDTGHGNSDTSLATDVEQKSVISSSERDDEPPPYDSIAASTDAQKTGLCEVLGPQDHQLSAAPVLDDQSFQQTMDLMIELLLEDVTELKSRVKGKGREGEADDEGESLAVLERELTNKQLEIADLKFSRSIAAAMETDGEAIRQSVAEEETAERDHQMALELSGRRSSRSLSEKESQRQRFGSNLDSEYMAKLAALYHHQDAAMSILDDDEITGEQQAESSSAAQRRAQWKAKHDNKTCTSCENVHKFADVVRLPCGCEYCMVCINTLFELSMDDEALYPPRCHGKPIDLATVAVFLSPKTRSSFKAKKPELDTADKTYCHDPNCNIWLCPANIVGDDNLACPECCKLTCTMCKAAGHGGDCPSDAPLQQLKVAAEANHWQRCYNCKRFVELTYGCNHMTCICRAQFCYECGGKWKSCTCLAFLEERLIDRATHIYNRGNRHHGTNGLQAQQEIRRIADHLERNHECEHRRFTRVNGRHRCEECQNVLYQFIMECRQCDLRVCHRCRMNRL